MLTDALPADAEYVRTALNGRPSGSQATYNSANNTLTIPAITQSATNLYCGNPCITYWNVLVTVRYPDAKFNAGDQPVNKITADITYADGFDADPLVAEAKITLVDELKRMSASKTNYTSQGVNPQPGQPVSWNIQNLNSGNVTLEDVIVTDALPQHLTDVKIGLSYWQPSQSGGSGLFEYSTDGGATWETLGTLTTGSPT